LRPFSFSPDPSSEKKLLEVVGLYMNPSENELAPSLDQKMKIEALDRTQAVLPLRNSKPHSSIIETACRMPV
jgi:hypothetical protein